MKKLLTLIVFGLAVGVAQAEPTPEAKALIKAQMEKAEFISPADLDKALKAGEKLVLLDIRQKSERPILGLITADDVHIPRGHLEIRTYGQIPDRDANIVVYCGKGIRSAFAANTLKEMGYTKVRALQGGTKAWKEMGLPTIKP
jgi:rhodanese-related sulfurtransferase